MSNFIGFSGIDLEKTKKLPCASCAWVIERGHLMYILEKALLLKISPAQLSFSTTIKRIEERRERVRVEFQSGDIKEYDFVIIGEGINSTTRSLLFPKEERIFPLGQTLKYAWFDKSTGLGDNGAIFFTEHHIGVIHPPYTRNLLGYYFKDGTPSEKQRLFEQKMFKVIKEPDGQETSIDQTTSRTFDLKSIYLPRYHSKRTVLVGDAAHGRPPTLGFGTSLAVEDSVAICKILNETDSLDTIEPALAYFSKVRAKRIKEVYRLQYFLHKFITGNKLKLRVLSAFLQIFAQSIFSMVKKLASYKSNTIS